MLKKIYVISMGLLFGGCASQSLESYRNQKPELKLEEFFNGDLIAHGMFQKRDGTVTRTFVVTMRGTWVNGVGKLEEDFIYNDGEKQKRIWEIKKIKQGQYSGTAGDIVGEAIGESKGSALHWRYTMALVNEGKTYNIFFDDWMYMVDEKTMLNKSVLTKFGIEVGQVILSIQRK